MKPRTTCVMDCSFGCSQLCQCGCHRETDYRAQTEAVHLHVMANYNVIFDKVAEKRRIYPDELAALRMDHNRAVLFHGWLESKGYVNLNGLMTHREGSL